MGLIAKILTGKAAPRALGHVMDKRAARRAPVAAGTAEYIPAGEAATGSGRLGANANAIARRANDFYKQNPKLVASIGLVGALAALAALKRRSF